MADDIQSNDIIQQLRYLNGNATSVTNTTLNKIYTKLDKISQAVLGMEQDSSDSYIRDNTRLRRASNKHSDTSWNPSDSDMLNMSKRMLKSAGTFLDEFEKQLTDSLISSHFKRELKGTFDRLAKQLGTTVEDLPDQLAKLAAQRWADRAKNTRLGQWVSNKAQQRAENLSSRIKAASTEDAAIANIKAASTDAAIANINSRYASIREAIPFMNAAQMGSNLRVFGLSAQEYNSRSVSELQTILANQQALDIAEVERLINGGESSSRRGSDLSDQPTQTAQELEQLSNSAAVSAIAADVARIRALLEEFNSDTVASLDGPQGSLSSTLNSVINPGGNSLGDAVESLTNNMGGLGDEVLNAAAAQGTEAVSAAIAEEALSSVAGVAGVAGTALQLLGPTIQSTRQAFKEFLSEFLSNRWSQQRKVRLDAEITRLTEDVKTIIEAPFNILKESAQAVYDAWDKNIRLINATQGYTKSDLQDLMATFADRIRRDNLTDVVSGTSIIENLTKVLESGLSGKIAEEFAYRATLLNAAVPTQDFFGYASTYSSIAANAIKDGKSQSEAIAAANASLHDFANNLVYAGRELAGGFSTGLRDAQSLYEQSVRIVQAARGGDVSRVSGVMTSVAAIIGATAPDIASSITDAVYKAAVGGNASNIVALRSLAGVNASNTEFLRALATDPQAIFSQMFRTLATIFNDSSDAYMEKAEGYAELFGLSAEAFQRVDFNYLAKAISEMNVSSDALSQNMEMLASGQTTLSQEEMKNRQINQFMIEEGLSYVLDNAAARSIQEHMWQEELTNELKEAEYVVNWGASTQKFANKIIDILSSLPGVGHIAGYASAKENKDKYEKYQREIANVVAMGQVTPSVTSKMKVLVPDENGNWIKSEAERDAMYYALTQANPGGMPVRSVSWIPDSLSDLMSYTAEGRKYQDNKFPGGPSIFGTTSSESYSDLVALDPYTGSKATSGYNWNVVGKSKSNIFKKFLQAIFKPGSARSATLTSAGRISSSVANNILQLLSEDYMKEFTGYNSGKTFDDWMASASKFGIADVSKALEAAGTTIDEMQQQFTRLQGIAVSEENTRLQQLAGQFNEAGVNFFNVTFPGMELRLDTWFTDLTTLLTSSWEREFELIDKLIQQFSIYFISRSKYLESIDFKQVEAIQSKEKQGTGDAVYALAEALTSNTTELKDPTLQTNALLGQILIVLNTLMQQGMLAPTAQPLDSQLTGLALGRSNSNLF